MSFFASYLFLLLIGVLGSQVQGAVFVVKMMILASSTFYCVSNIYDGYDHKASDRETDFFH